MSTEQYGSLYLIPTRLGEESPPLEVLPISIKRIVEQINHYIVENEKSARRFIKKVSPSKSQASLQLEILNKFTEIEVLSNFLDPCLEGMDVGLLSEAGSPAIADPGADVVAIAHQKNIRTIPMVGPSSIIMAMMGSGLNGQNFAFNGYLPIETVDRKKAIKMLEKRSKELQQSQLFIETPYRNNKMLDSLKSTLNPGTMLCVGCDITLSTEYIKTLPTAEWKKQNINLHKRPTVFIIQAG